MMDEIDMLKHRIRHLREALKWYSNMLDGREHLSKDERTEITYGELWKAREALRNDELRRTRT